MEYTFFYNLDFEKHWPLLALFRAGWHRQGCLGAGTNIFLINATSCSLVTTSDLSAAFQTLTFRTECPSEGKLALCECFYS